MEHQNNPQDGEQQDQIANEVDLSEAGTNEKSGLMKVFLILTFISNGLGLLFMLLFLVMAGTIATMFADVPGVSEMVATMGGATWYVIVSILLTAASFYGALQLWKGVKQGLFIYGGAQVVALILPIVIGAGFSFVGLAFTAGWIAVYFMGTKEWT